MRRPRFFQRRVRRACRRVSSVYVQNPRDEVEFPPVTNAHAFCSGYCFTAIDLRVIIRQLFLTSPSGFTANGYFVRRVLVRLRISRSWTYANRTKPQTGACCFLFTNTNIGHEPRQLFWLLCNKCEYLPVLYRFEDNGNVIW